MRFFTIPQPVAVLAMAAFVVCSGLCSAARAQTPAATNTNAAPGTAAAPNPNAPATTPAKKRAQAQKKPSPSQPVPATTASVTPPAMPPPPNWPANDAPVPAAITWDSQGLRIVASNSSLDQILREISTVTGTKIEGYAADQRVFGSYGPGSERAVLFKLLDGSGYNVLMVGDLGPGTPRQIVLSAPPNGPAPPVTNTPAEEEPAPDPEAQQPEQPPPAAQPTQPPGYTPGMPVRTPQQIIQEMQQRQQQLQQMQQQQQQNSPPPQNQQN